MFGLWWQALPRERASGLGTLAGSNKQLFTSSGMGIKGNRKRCFIVRREREAVMEDTQRRGLYVL